MVTLAELVNMQKLTGATDLTIIRDFLIENDYEEQALDLINDLTKSKISKLKQKNHMAEEWASYLPSEYLYQNYDLKTATWLHKMELNYICYGGELNKQFLDIAKERVPNTKLPEVYFQPLIMYLEEQGIMFQGER